MITHPQERDIVAELRVLARNRHLPTWLQIEEAAAEIQRLRAHPSPRECAMHVFAARKIHEIAVRLMTGSAEDALASLQDEGELHKAIHAALAGKCAQDWIDQQLATEPSPREVALEKALIDATAHLDAATSAYRKYAKRHKSLGRVLPDPFYSTRIKDFQNATDRCRSAISPSSEAQKGEGG